MPLPTKGPKIFVGYRLAAPSDADKQPPFALADEGGWHRSVFDEIFLSALYPVKDVGRWSYKPDKPDRMPGPFARDWLMKHFKSLWEPGDADKPAAAPIFIGFDVSNFLARLGDECSRPAVGRPLPLDVWYDGGRTIDLIRLLSAADSEHSEGAFRTMAQLAARLRGIAVPDGWEPGQSPEEDVRISIEVATQFGIPLG